MQTIILKKHFGLLALAILIAQLLGTDSIASAQSSSGNTGTVSDAPPNMVRSDGGGAYIEGVACANVAIFSPGIWQLRTVTNSGTCNGEPSYWTPGATVFHRWLTLDFGSPVSPTTSTTPGDLDGNGVAQQQEFAPARFYFEDAFVRKATTTPVEIYVLKVLASGATTQATAWEIDYRNRATIVVNGDGSRTLSLSAGAATADVYMISPLPHGKTQSNFMGTYDLPFSVVAK